MTLKKNDINQLINEVIEELRSLIDDYEFLELGVDEDEICDSSIRAEDEIVEEECSLAEKINDKISKLWDKLEEVVNKLESLTPILKVNVDKKIEIVKTIKEMINDLQEIIDGVYEVSELPRPAFTERTEKGKNLTLIRNRIIGNLEDIIEKLEKILSILMNS